MSPQDSHYAYSRRPISHHYCGWCTAVEWTLFWKNRSLGFEELPQDLRFKSLIRKVAVSLQTTFATCSLLLQNSHNVLGRKTNARHIEQWGFFSVSHLLRHEVSVYNGHLRGPVTLTTIAKPVAVELSLPVFYDCLSRLGFKHSNFRSNPCATAAAEDCKPIIVETIA